MSNRHWEEMTPEQHDEGAAYFRELLAEETLNPLDDNGTGKATMRLGKWKSMMHEHMEAAERKRKAQAE